MCVYGGGSDIARIWGVVAVGAGLECVFDCVARRCRLLDCSSICLCVCYVRYGCCVRFGCFVCSAVQVDRTYGALGMFRT